MAFHVLKILEQIVDFLVFGNKKRLSNQCFPVKIFLVDVSKQIFDKQNAFYLVDIVPIHRNSGKSFFDNFGINRLERFVDFQCKNIHSRTHNLLGIGVSESHDSFQYFLLFRRTFVRIGQFQCLRQLIDREIRLLFSQFVVQIDGDFAHWQTYWRQQFVECRNGISNPFGKLDVVPAGIDFGQNLAKQQD